MARAFAARQPGAVEVAAGAEMFLQTTMPPTHRTAPGSSLRADRSKAALVHHADTSWRALYPCSRQEPILPLSSPYW